MMKLTRRCALILLLCCGRVFSADSVNLGVTGNIVASPCIFNGGNANLDVHLGNIQATNMVTPGSSSDPVDFNLLFTQCPAGTRSVTVSFTGNPDPAAGADYYRNSGSATHVAIAMREAATGTLKGTGSSITQNIAADRTATIAMQASVTSVTGGATPGSISAVVVMTMQYN
ncbi:fimbrial protein [Enterobacter sp. RHBSTW-00175]|jgi:minor fimbrial subunit|uniref:fimbrial protein n=1 Tax=Enterobacter sp. RHBSTW-00175 TaxID=2742639 RepID=UPI0038F63A9B